MSLILLVIMTLLGLAGIRGITQQERMATHSFDRSLAFQATEAALVDVEKLVDTHSANIATLLAAVATCNTTSELRICAIPLAADKARWLDDAFTLWKSLPAVGTGDLAVTPQYFVDYLGNNFECQPGDPSTSTDCKRFRITARSNDGTSGRSSVMLQSIYATE